MCLQSMWSEWSRVSRWGVSSESAVDEGQWHRGHAGPHLYCQWGSVWTGRNGLCVCVYVELIALLYLEGWSVMIWFSVKYLEKHISTFRIVLNPSETLLCMYYVCVIYKVMVNVIGTLEEMLQK